MSKLRNHIYLIVGRSGSGKTAIVEYIQKNFKNMTSIESYTTRPRRFDGETGHIFVTDEEFDQLADFVAYTEFDGYRYAATAQQVEDNTFYVVDPAGIRYFLGHYKGQKIAHIVVIDAPLHTRFMRMCKRNGVLKAIKRIWHDRCAFGRIEDFADIIIRNDRELHEAVSELLSFIDQEERE